MSIAKIINKDLTVKIDNAGKSIEKFITSDEDNIKDSKGIKDIKLQLKRMSEEDEDIPLISRTETIQKLNKNKNTMKRKIL